MNKSFSTFGWLVLISLGFAQPGLKSQYDFQRANWGMTKEQVKTSEEEQKSILIIETDDRLGYLDIVEKQQCLITYYFADRKLQKGIYTFIERQTEAEAYRVNYYQLKGSLIQKYGKPFFEQKRSDAGPHSASSSSTNSVKYETTWKLDNALVSLMLTGNEFFPRLLIEYKCPDAESGPE